MLLACSSCNSKYLVNSADFKPDGRTVKCVKCNHEWFQEPNFIEENFFESNAPSTFKEENSQLKQEETYTSKATTSRPSARGASAGWKYSTDPDEP